MNFKDASKVAAVVEKMHEVDSRRAINRTRINTLFNGNPPYTEQEAQENRIHTNVNFLEGSKIAHDARQQWEQAFLQPDVFFRTTTDKGPKHKRDLFGHIFTKEINKVLKGSLSYVEQIKSTAAQVVLHGIGPVSWENKYQWCPYSIGIEDLLTPTKTLCSLENLEHFAIHRAYTPGKLYEMTHGEKVDKGWNKPMVEAILAALEKEDISGSTDLDSYRFPEKVAEAYKENAGYYDSDAVPTVNVWDFYFRNNDRKWNRRIILDCEHPLSSGEELISKELFKNKFLYNPEDRVYAEELSQIIHVQFGNVSNVAPFRWHSVRSLGYMLYAVCHLMNRLRCKFADAVFEHLLTLFKNVSDGDRERLEMVILHHMGIIPEGIHMVPGNERHQLDHNLLNGLFGQLRQLMGENSASFTQQINDGTNREMTAREVLQRASLANAMLSAILNNAYTYQKFQYVEMVRRFCIQNSQDNEVVEFQKRCKAEGLPESHFKPEYWQVHPEKTLGNGNKVLQVAQAEAIMGVRQQLEPDAQRKATRIYLAATVDPDLANELVPFDEQPVSEGMKLAIFSIGALMAGFPVIVYEGISHIDYVETLIKLLEFKVGQIKKSGKVPDRQTIMGLLNVEDNIWTHIDIIASDDNEKQRVKQYGDVLGKLMNIVKEFIQALKAQMEQSAEGQGLPAELMAKLEQSRILAESQAKIAEAQAAQKLQHEEQRFAADQRRRDVKTVTDAKTKVQKAAVDSKIKDMTAQADVIRDNATAAQKKEAKPNKPK